MEERPTIVEPTEETEEGWRQFLAEFKENVLPIFSQHGMTMGEALVVWKLNEIGTTLNNIETSLDKGIL